MPKLILAEHGSPTALTITLASLATGAARQCTIVSNVDNAIRVYLHGLITTGTSPTVNTYIEIYLIRSDGTIRTDNAGASDAAITLVTASLIKAIKVSGSSDVGYRWDAVIEAPGPEWAIAVKNGTGVNLNSTGGNHSISYTTEALEVQD